MEGRVGRRSCRTETSPERAKVCVTVKPRVPVKPTFRKVQVVYYLSRNGQLEHPHYMEVTHLAHQQLRLKDVMDRLTVLRGKGMPSLYSWSCKRSYKNGYVWNDLAENDIIHPSEGAEYVLKGSELFLQEKFQQLEFSSNNRSQVPDTTTFHPKRKPLATKRHSEQVVVVENNRYEQKDDIDNDNEEDDEEDDDDDDDDNDKTSNTSSITPHYSQCSRGVSTEETELTHKNNPTTELTLCNSSPPSTTSSTISEKANDGKRYEDGDPVTTESSATVSRNSVLLQLISCGGSTSFRSGKSVAVPVVKQEPPSTVARKSLHKGVLCKTAAEKVVVEEEEREMIGCMSENPRFGNLVAEEKEYFSGSIVEAMGEERVHQVEPRLKRSTSYNEERGSTAELVDAEEEEPKRDKSVMKVKCIPRKKSSSSKQPKK